MALFDEAKTQVGGDVIKMSEGAKKINYSYVGIMKLHYEGTKSGKLKVIQRGKRFFIREDDLRNYPYMSTHGIAYHYDKDWKKYQCPECSAYFSFGVGKPCSVATSER